jgi:hypothetical protein
LPINNSNEHFRVEDATPKETKGPRIAAMMCKTMQLSGYIIKGKTGQPAP